MDERLTAAVIPPSVLAGVVAVAEADGVDVAPWFAGTGLTAATLVTADAPRISFRQASAVLRRAVRTMPGRPLGLRTGARDVLLTFGMLGVAIRSCATIAEALTIGLEFHQASGSLIDLEAEYFPAEFALRLYERSPDPPIVAFLCEEAMCSTTMLIRSMLGDRENPSYIELTYPEPPCARDYQRFFRCPIRYGAEANRMMFPLSVLEAPLRTPDRAMQSAAVEACRRLIGATNTSMDVVATVETILDANLRQPLGIADVAARLNVSERTLRRQLSSAGKTFVGIHNRLRERRANFLLTESSLSIARIAAEVGFSDGREFRRAYRRWTGVAPRDIRRGTPIKVGSGQAAGG